MIGDSPASDIGAAAAAGIDSVWLGARPDWPRQDFQPTLFAPTFPTAVDAIIRR